MVLVTETEEGRPWAESRIKSLTGGDRISARVMRGDPFEFAPQFKLWIAGNHRPVLHNPDPAMRRRLHLMPLTYVPPKPDTTLPDVLKAESPGILAWAIKGCLAWQREGLNPPQIVLDASAEYFAEQDSVANWFAERCERTRGAETSTRALFTDWQQWAKTRGEDPGTERRFSGAMERFAARKRTKTARVFMDVRLLPSETGVW
jgi:putative DNA primase/helicase